MEIWPALLKHSEGNLAYREGVELFLFLNPRSPLATFFQIEDRYSRRRLKALLDAKFEELSLNKKENAFKSFAVSKNRNNKINLEILPQELREDYSKQSPRIRQISQLHAQIKIAQSDQQRYELACKMMPLVQERRLCFMKIDQYMNTGTNFSIDKKPKQLQVKAKPVLEKNYKIEYEIKLLRSQKTKLAKKPRRFPEYQEVCKKLDELLLKRYDAPE